MTDRLRVCLYATDLQANTYALAHHLSTRDDVEALVVCEREVPPAEPVREWVPIRCPIVSAADPDAERRLRQLAPQVTIVDNHFPARAWSPALATTWHGFGWKGPQDRREFAQIHRAIRRLTGCGGDRPNPRFRWLCAGPTDARVRAGVSGFAAENLRVTGQPYLDLIIDTRVPRDELRRHYPPRLRDRKLALLAFTWQYGRVFAHWGGDIEVFRHLFAAAERLGCGLILRLHDRRRFDAPYVAALERLAAAHGVLVKFKDEHPDNLLDILASDVVVSNYSSLLTFFYATGRPSIHVHPVAADAPAVWREWRGGRVREQRATDPARRWRMPLSEHGGLVAHSPDELIAALTRSLAEPDCCRERSADFCRRHLAPLDGQSCARVAAEVAALATA